MIKIERLCEVCGSNEYVRNYKRSGRYLCGKHAMQLRTHGKIFERTSKDPNIYIVCEDYALICIYNKSCEEIARAIIDKSDIETAKQFKWYLHSNEYVCNKTGGKITYLHRLLINAPKDKFVDHINMNKLDNRKINLRLCNNGENMRNKEQTKRNYSGFRGVHWNKDVKKWNAILSYDRSSINLGYYDLFQDAVNARINGEQKYYGDFAPQSDLIKMNNLIITETEFMNGLKF